ncbi:hypothetical protein AC1031_003660 [Aphanomyces cochlioides]|nr:hypothetical protein AC1031_003660 [Aphanomyces cochlioides]
MEIFLPGEFMAGDNTSFDASWCLDGRDCLTTGLLHGRTTQNQKPPRLANTHSGTFSLQPMRQHGRFGLSFQAACPIRRFVGRFAIVHLRKRKFPTLPMTTIPGPYETTRGTCLSPAWSAGAAANINVNPNARDSFKRRMFPYLQPALKHPRYKMKDPRLAGGYDPSCALTTPGGVLRGVGERVFPNGTIAVPGRAKDTFVIEVEPWLSHKLSSAILSIIVQEVVGYDVSFYEVADISYVSERLSTVGRGVCTPTHANVEVWTTSSSSDSLTSYSNDTTSASVGYNAQSGLYTLSSNVKTALQGNPSGTPPFQRPRSADFWREFVQSDDLINFYSVQNTLNLSRVSKPEFCPDGTLGCKNGCSKNDACTAAEAAGRPCILVAMMAFNNDPGYFQAMVSNNNIPAYFCFAGYDGVNQYVLDSMKQNRTIIFYHYQPDLFHHENNRLFTRITFPRGETADVAPSTGTFGEQGYGNKTTNPVSVDAPLWPLHKYYSNAINDNPALLTAVSHFQITSLDMTYLLAVYAYVIANNISTTPVFDTACYWTQLSLYAWRLWTDPLPLCTIDDHMDYTIIQMNKNTSRLINFTWIAPDPDNATLPYQCDGGFLTLPPPLQTTRSVAWLEKNFDTWTVWVNQLPACERIHYNYSIGSCNSKGERYVGFFWLLPRNDLNGSYECSGGVSLPSNVSIPCDYVPFNAPIYSGITALAVIIMISLIGFCVTIVVHRARSTIKRAQWPLLLLIVIGGIVMCAYVLVSAGEPSDAICAARPLLSSGAFSLSFTAVFVKSLRVYVVVNTKASKKIKLTLWRMIEFYTVIVAIDIGIILASLIFDPPCPSIAISNSTTFDGTIDHVSCHASSFIFSAMSIFWKSLVLAAGLYIAFQIRHADEDFQETYWIMASAGVIIFGALLLTPIVYFLDLTAATTFALRSVILLLGTIIVISLMIAPKLHRLHKAIGGTATTYDTSTNPATNKLSSYATSDHTDANGLQR